MRKWISLLLSFILVINVSFMNIGHAESTVSDPETSVLPEFRSLEDPALRRYIESTMYGTLVSELNSDEYFVENVSSVYISQDYLEELEYNSRANVFFGYTLSELEAQFGGNRYVFTLGENNETVVEPWEDYVDPMGQVIKNVAVGTGVILVCVTVSAVTAGTGAYACSMIFAMAAKTGAIMAAKGGALGAVSAGAVKLVQTGNLNEAFDAALMGGSEGYKWGAITGALTGGITKGATLYGEAKQTAFTMHDYATIQHETGYPLDVIKQFHTMDEFKVFKAANLKSQFIGNKSALIKTDIDLNKVDSKGRTNLERMKQGLAPQDASGTSYELHHVGQKKDGTLAILSQSEHDSPHIHGFLERTEAHAEGTKWDSERQAFWKAFAEYCLKGGLVN